MSGNVTNDSCAEPDEYDGNDKGRVSVSNGCKRWACISSCVGPRMNVTSVANKQGLHVYINMMWVGFLDIYKHNTCI